MKTEDKSVLPDWRGYFVAPVRQSLDNMV